MKQQHDLFGSHQTAAVVEAQRRYQTKFHPNCCLLVSAHDILYRVQQAFVDGVAWKEEQEKITNNQAAREAIARQIQTKKSK